MTPNTSDSATTQTGSATLMSNASLVAASRNCVRTRAFSMTAKHRARSSSKVTALPRVSCSSASRLGCCGKPSTSGSSLESASAVSVLPSAVRKTSWSTRRRCCTTRRARLTTCSRFLPVVVGLMPPACSFDLGGGLTAASCSSRGNSASLFCPSSDVNVAQSKSSSGARPSPPSGKGTTELIFTFLPPRPATLRLTFSRRTSSSPSSAPSVSTGKRTLP
mmetsp:Transcript_24867/g.76784  ORF Transcript_24867/g.76784 Transcript_24867/m.76784 type:complete len:220 (+) Transcript_24867:787-1446(+)